MLGLKIKTPERYNGASEPMHEAKHNKPSSKRKYNIYEDAY